MTSLYATAWSLGAPAPLALTIHGIGAAIAVSLLVMLWKRGTEPRTLAAATCVTSLFISPYNYDYDLPILGLAIAFVFPLLLEKARRPEWAGLLALSWTATGFGLVVQTISDTAQASVTSLGGVQGPALAAPALIALIAWTWAILRRPDQAGAPV